MNQDNPFAKLGALDQQLYHDTMPKAHDSDRDKVSEKLSEEKHTDAGLLANQQTSKPAKKQASLPTNLQTSKLANQQTSPQSFSTKEKKKYGTYLREDSIFNIQVHAIQTKKKDHEVLQDAVDFYLKNIKK